MITTVSDSERAQTATIGQLRQEVTAWSVTVANLEAECDALRARIEEDAQSWYKLLLLMKKQMKKYGWHPGRTDDDLIDVLDEKLDALAADTERLNHLIDNRAYIVSDASCCDGYWLHYERPDGSTWFQSSEYETPRAAIDAAMKDFEANHD